MKVKAYLLNVGLERSIAHQLGDVRMELETDLLNAELEGTGGEGQPDTK